MSTRDLRSCEAAIEQKAENKQQSCNTNGRNKSRSHGKKKINHKENDKAAEKKIMRESQFEIMHVSKKKKCYAEKL